MRGAHLQQPCQLRFAHLAAITMALVSASCSPMQEDTPEPGETAEIKALAQKLGLGPSWIEKLKARVTGDPVEPANGAILYEWLDRRKATLEGRLEAHRMPALKNPGKVSDTIAWEREAQLKDEQSLRSLEAYQAMTEKMRWECPAVIRQEREWFAQYQVAHAAGKEQEVANWDLRALQLQIPCRAEIDGTEFPETADATQTQENVAQPASVPDTRPFTPAEQALIRRHDDAESNCRGSDDEAEREQGCRDRDVLLDQLYAKGICWGREDETYAEYTTHRCVPGSIGYQP